MSNAVKVAILCSGMWGIVGACLFLFLRAFIRALLEADALAKFEDEIARAGTISPEHE